jgi:hypothetical protein
MTEFNALFSEILVSDLPEHIVESNHFISWRELFPHEPIFSIETSVYIDKLDINSQEDLDRIINSDCVLGFNKKARMNILKNLEIYWNENPNSAHIILPEKDKSFFSNQIYTFIKETSIEMILVSCMKHGYIELFDYIYEKEQINYTNNIYHISYNNNTFNKYSLLYYAVLNENIEMIKRGLEIGLEVTGSLFMPAIQTGSIEIYNLLFENKNVLDYQRELDICDSEYTSPEIFKIFLDSYVNKYGKDPSKLVVYTVRNLANMKQLVLNYDMSTIHKTGKTIVYNLFDECISRSTKLEVVLFIEEQFKVTIKEYREHYIQKYSKQYYISNSILWNDNYELYNYLYTNGFLVDNIILQAVTNRRLHKITPGLVKKHLREQSEREQYELHF